MKQKLLISPLYDIFGKRSYSQSAEDLIADVELKKRKGGFYVDIGAYHPKLFSNTYLFYKKGWRGICVDPNPKMEELFAKARPRDKFLNVGVGSEEEVREYFVFDDGAVNTFSAEQADQNVKVGRKLRDKKMIAVLPLSTIFEKYLPKPDQRIDLLSVDVEGMDEEVLRSGDWERFRPELVICEDLSFYFKRWNKSGTVKFLDSVGYVLVAKTPYSLIFKQGE